MSCVPSRLYVMPCLWGQMECERRRRALQGDVAASVASEPFMSSLTSYSEAGFKDEDRRAVTGRGGDRSGDTEKSCDDEAPRNGDQVGPPLQSDILPSLYPTCI